MSLSPRRTAEVRSPLGRASVHSRVPSAEQVKTWRLVFDCRRPTDGQAAETARCASTKAPRPEGRHHILGRPLASAECRPTRNLAWASVLSPAPRPGAPGQLNVTSASSMCGRRRGSARAAAAASSGQPVLRELAVGDDRERLAEPAVAAGRAAPGRARSADQPHEARVGAADQVLHLRPADAAPRPMAPSAAQSRAAQPGPAGR